MTHEPATGPYLPAALDWSMVQFGGWIERSDLASDDPSEWAYEDLEIYYAAGRCHHLAVAYMREAGCQIGVVVETDPDELAEPDLVVPLHVFAVDGPTGFARDIRGTRPITEIVDELAGTVGLMAYEVRTFDCEKDFVSAFVDRRDRPLVSYVDADISAATGLVGTRDGHFAHEHAEISRRREAEIEASTKATRTVGIQP